MVTVIFLFLSLLPCNVILQPLPSKMGTICPPLEFLLHCDLLWPRESWEMMVCQFKGSIHGVLSASGVSTVVPKK